MDNLFNNAMSHFIHNMFFLLGDEMETSAEAENIEAQIAKAYPVETYDTGIFRAFTRSGVELMFFGSHVAEKKVDPCFRIEFEKGFVELKSGSDKIIAKTLDKKEFSYPSPDSDHQFKKLFVAIDNVISPGKIICSPEAAVSQIKLANAVDKLCGDAKMFSGNLIIKNDERLFVKGLDDLLLSGYKDFRMVEL
jgi:predicted dehydrogenase